MELYPLLLSAVHFVLLMFPSLAEHDNFTDLSALLAFKAHVSDPYNTLSANWTTNASFCTWTGVSCSRRRQRVVALDIQDLALYGTIAPHIGNMSFLSHLSLANNSFVGHIPSSLSQLPRLKTLYLQMNQLSGSIPTAIFNMSLLASLYLGKNNLSGALPTNHSFIDSVLPQIQDLSLSYNQISGSIPSGLSNCYRLRRLSLSFNYFSGNIPSELGNLKQLTSLLLGDNNLTGTIPTSLGNLTNLLKLDLSSNIIHGVIPEELGGLTNLQLLMLNWNYGVTGPIPTLLSNMSSLALLDLAYCELTGPIRVHFGNMPNLKILFLGGNKLTGGFDFLLSLANCRVLDSVGLWKNQLDGSLPSTIGNLSSSLLQFIVHENHIKGKIPAELGNLSSLLNLDLGENELVGTIPSEVGMLGSLQLLVFANNGIYGSIPHEFGQLRTLNILYLDGNNLSGSIPDSLGNISGLQHLKLSANALSSRIPQSLWSLTGLIELNLSRNFLDGVLSEGVGNIKTLDTFDISMNRLSGEIPNALKELQMLRYLDLSFNSFTGNIPQSLGELIGIEVLNFSCNNLSGAIPNSLANLRYLSNINLSFNKLEGKIPSSGGFLNISRTSLLGNVALCGAPRLGFPPCSANFAVSNSSTRKHLLKYILPAIAFTVILVSCICILLKFCWNRTKGRALTSTQSPNNYRLISYHELVRATENFSGTNLLGRGNFGSVYKGCLDDGQLAAIKVLNLEVDGASKSFDSECQALCMVRHRNLIKILSTCSNLDFRALVLPFMPNGSLEMWLHSPNYCLNLLQRINIVIDVASALEYLHHYSSQVVVHCDLKPSNVLLSEDMTTRVSDFGIAKVLFGDNWTLTSTSTPGTIGYMAPEYASTGRVSIKGDVYSFGILLLEIFTRKKPTDPMFVGELTLRQWVSDAHPAAMLEIVDCNLLNDGCDNERPREDIISMHACLSSIMELGILCSTNSSKERLLMKEVVPKLEKIKADYLSKFPIA